MASTILLRNIGGVDDKRGVISNSQLARTLFIGTTWTKIRIGLRLSFASDTGSNLASGKMFIGACSGLANLIGDATTTNWVGFGPAVYATGETFTRAAGPPPSYSASFFIARRVGTTYTSGAGAAGHIMADPVTGYRSLFFVDITKGSPNYTLQQFRRSVNTTPADVTLTEFLAQMEAAVPALGQHALASSGTLACDEGAGSFDSVNVSWSITTPGLEISDFAVARLS